MTTHSDALPDLLIPDSLAARRAASRRWWFLAIVLVISPLVLIVAAILALVVWLLAQHGAALREVQGEVARIQATGEPITTKDLHAYHRVAPGTKDITYLWLAALDSIDDQKFTVDAKPLPIVGEGDANTLPPGDMAGAEQLLGDYNTTVQATLVAAQAEGECRFAVEFERGFSALLPNAQKMRTLARLMKLRSRVAAAKGDAEMAVQSVEAIFAGSQAMGHQLTLIEHLVRLATATMALREVEFLQSEVELTDEQLAHLQARVAAIDFEQGLTTGLLGERAMGYHAFHHMEQMSGGDITGPPNPGEGSLLKPADCRIYLGFMQDLLAASREPFPQAIDQADKSEQRLKQLAGTKNLLEKYNAMMTLLILPATAASFQATGRNLALRDATLCAIAAERYRLKHGQPPQQLAELVPEFLPVVPTDPFDGQPLRLKVDGDGLVFYSVGKDRKDDGGQENNHSGEPDIVVTLKRRSK